MQQDWVPAVYFSLLNAAPPRAAAPVHGGLQLDLRDPVLTNARREPYSEDGLAESVKTPLETLWSQAAGRLLMDTGDGGHKEPQGVVRVRLSIPFVFLHQGQYHVACVHASLPGNRHADTSDRQNAFDWGAYAALEPASALPCAPEWQLAQLQFVHALSAADIGSLVTYMFDGDMVVNNYLLHKAGKGVRFFPFGERSPSKKWFLKQKVWGRNKHVLFGDQVERCFGVRGASAQAARLRSLSRRDWARLLDTYMGDMCVIFRRAPVLTRPMVVYRGEQAHENLWLAGQSFVSCSLDPSAAVSVAHSTGKLYRITLPPGTPVVFAAGMQKCRGVFDCECLLPPGLEMTETARRDLVQLPVVDVHAQLTPGVALWTA